jgi:hypothetical protein
MDAPKFIFLCGTPAIFFLSLLLLSSFWKKEMTRLVGLYSTVATLNVIALMLTFPLGDFDQTLIISAFIDFVFIIPIVYYFRHLYKMGFVVPWGLLIFEIFRSVRLILYSLSSRPALSYFEAYLYYFYYFVPFAVLLYSIFTRDKSKEMPRTAV